MTATTPSPRARAAHLGPERRRPLVLDAAFRLFLERGYEGTSMEAVARAAGVTKPVVYSCFRSKEALFTALLRREEERVLKQIAAALPGDVELGDPETTLAEGFTAFLRGVAESPDSYRVVFLGEGGVNAAVARRIREGREAQVQAVGSLVRWWLEAAAGSDRSSEDLTSLTHLLSHAIVGLAESGARTLLEQPERWTPETLGPVLAALTARGQEAFAAGTS